MCFFLWLLAGLIGLQGTSAFFFFWQTSTSQCGVYSLRWQNGTAPFTASIIPIYGQPFFYDIPPEAYQNNYGEYDLQLNAGTSYVVVMSDATGTGAGGSSQIVRVQVSNMTDCLYTAPQNATNLDFTFSVSGIAEQCKRGFELAWSGGREYGPYNFTVVPLDQSFRPYDVALQKGVVSMSDWRLNMTERTRFTVMMNNAQGYGRGGVAGIYEVAAGGDSNCVSQSLAPTGPWPIGLATNTLSPPTLPVTDPAGDKKGLKGGAIAGVVIGVLAFFAILASALLFLLKRKRRRQAAAKRIEEHEVDLADAYDGEDDLRRGQSNVSSHVEPYHRLDPFIGGQSESFEESREGTMTSAGSAGVGAGLVPSRSASGDILEESDRPSGPGVAGPLPSKNQPPSSPSSPTSPGRTLPTRRPLSGTSHSLKNDLLTQSSDTNVMFPPPVVTPNQGMNQGISQGRSMRVINPDDPTSLPTLPPGSRVDDRRSRAAGPTYRRHEDAGRVPVRRDREEIVDLPPLYTDVPRDGPEYTTPSDINSSPLDDLNRDRRF